MHMNLNLSQCSLASVLCAARRKNSQKDKQQLNCKGSSGKSVLSHPTQFVNEEQLQASHAQG
jgi:hypothetical protein